jgi:alkanesulfonate monooxygenase SsuD/methylene tetrahydromethanopterin reductase-like flavin-dependent oxidoreductase (luciferase family)
MRLTLGLRARSTGLPDLLGSVAATAEVVDGFWTVATPDFDPFVIASQAWSTARASGASAPTTGIGVLPIADWTVTAAATAAATVSTLQGGGFRLGIGAGRVDSPAWRAARGLADDLRPATVVAESLTALRALLSGAAATVHGQFVRLEGVSIETTPPPVDLYVGAAGPAMLSVAGRLADGVLCSALAPEDLDHVRAVLLEARTRSDLARPVEVALSLPVVLDDEDPAGARAALVAGSAPLALGVPGLAPTRGFPGQLRRLGLGEELDALQAAVHAGGGPADLSRAVSDDLVGRLGAAGSVADVAARLASYAGAADELNLTFPQGLDPQALADLLERTRSLLASRPAD